MEIITINFITSFQVTKNLTLAGTSKHIIKMSSLLNISNGNKSEEFNFKDIEVLVDNKEQNWFKRAHIRWYLGIAHIITQPLNFSIFCRGKKNAEVIIWKYILPQLFVSNVFPKAGKILYYEPRYLPQQPWQNLQQEGNLLSCSLYSIFQQE